MSYMSIVLQTLTESPSAHDPRCKQTSLLNLIYDVFSQLIFTLDLICLYIFGHHMSAFIGLLTSEMSRAFITPAFDMITHSRPSVRNTPLMTVHLRSIISNP